MPAPPRVPFLISSPTSSPPLPSPVPMLPLPGVAPSPPTPYLRLLSAVVVPSSPFSSSDVSGKPRAMEVDIFAIRYKPPTLKAPHITTFSLKAFVWLMESPLLGTLITSLLKEQNNITQILQKTMIPEHPVYYPEYPLQSRNKELCSWGKIRTLWRELSKHYRPQCLPPYDPSVRWTTTEDKQTPFLCWKIHDFAHAYRSGITTLLAVAKHVIVGVEEWNSNKPPMPMPVYFNTDDPRKQVEASTKRFKQGRNSIHLSTSRFLDMCYFLCPRNPISILDGIFVAIKDDIGCFTYYHFFGKIRTVEKDTVCVAHLRKCGVIFIGKSNMHELGLGVTGKKIQTTGQLEIHIQFIDILEVLHVTMRMGEDLRHYQISTVAVPGLEIKEWYQRMDASGWSCRKGS